MLTIKKYNTNYCNLLYHCHRCSETHSNKDIVKDLSNLNTYKIRSGDDFIDTDYWTVRDSIKDRLKLLYEEREALGLKNGYIQKKDTVRTLGFIISPTGDLQNEPEKQEEFIKESIQFLKDRYGSNFISYQIHRDEIHNYRDARTGGKRTSMIHVHAQVLPITDDSSKAAEKVRTREEVLDIHTLNAKQIMTKQNLLKLQEDFRQHMGIEKYEDCHFRSIEDLKILTEKQELEESWREQTRDLVEQGYQHYIDTEIRNAHERERQAIEEAEAKANQIIEESREKVRKAEGDMNVAKASEQMLLKRAKDLENSERSLKRQLRAKDGQLAEYKSLLSGIKLDWEQISESGLIEDIERKAKVNILYTTYIALIDSFKEKIEKIREKLEGKNDENELVKLGNLER